MAELTQARSYAEGLKQEKASLHSLVFALKSSLQAAVQSQRVSVGCNAVIVELSKWTCMLQSGNSGYFDVTAAEELLNENATVSKPSRWILQFRDIHEKY